jgi:hypothetical protein
MKMESKHGAVMSKEVREAAQDILDCFACGRPDLAKLGSLRKLAEAWLAEHPEDDDDGLSVEWLLSVGFTPGNFDSMQIYHTTELLRIIVGGNESERWLRVGAALICTSPTRGDVRRLARALRVELGEGR